MISTFFLHILWKIGQQTLLPSEQQTFENKINKKKQNLESESRKGSVV